MKILCDYKRIFSGITAAVTLAALLPQPIMAAENEFCVSSVNVAENTQMLTNVSNASEYRTNDSNTYWDYSDSVYIDDYINIVFSDSVDKATVTKDSLKITQTDFNNENDKQITYTPIVDGNTVKIDLSNLYSNFSYKIDVTSAITDVNGAAAEEYSIDFTTGLISKAPHKEGKAIELVSIGKTAYRNETDGTETVISQLTDGLMEGTQIKCAQWSDTTKEFFTVDLGDLYDIASVGAFYPNKQASWHFYYSDFYVNDEKPTADYIDSTSKDVQIGPFGNGGVMAGNNNVNNALTLPKQGQYVSLKKKSDGPAYINEILVFAYKSDIVGDWDSQLLGNEVTFTVPFVPAVKSREYTMLMSTYDANGKMLEMTSSDNNDGVNYSGTINFAENAVSARAVIADKNNITAVKTKAGVYGEDLISKDLGEAPSFNEAIKYQAFDSKFILSGKKVGQNDLVNLSVVKSDSEDSGDAFSNIGTDELVYFAAAGGNGYEFSVPIEEEGKYWIRLAYIDESYKTAYKYFSFMVIDPDIKLQVVKAFTETDGTNLSEIARIWIDKEQIIGNLLDRSEIDEIGFGKIYTDIKDYLIPENPEINDIVNTLDNAIIINKINRGDSSLVSKLTDNENVRNYIANELGFSLTADVNCSYSESDTFTNIGNDGIVKILFNEPMRTDTLNSSNIVIKKDNAVLNYTPLSVSDKEYAIDIASFASDYQNLLTKESDDISIEVNGCLTADGKRLIKQYSYNFKGGIIIKAPHKDGMIIKNVALNKPVEVSGEGANVSTASKLTDGKWGVQESDLAKCGNVNPTYIDLESYYQVCGLHFVGWLRVTNGNYSDSWYTCGLHVEGTSYKPTFSSESISIYAANGRDGTVGKSHMHFAAGTPTTEFVRYIRVDKDRTFLNNNFWASELEVYAYVDEQIDAFSAPEGINEGGTNTVSINVQRSNNVTYGLLMSCYDKDGNVLKTKYTEKQAPTSIEGNITAPNGTVGMTVSLVSDLTGMKQAADNLTVGTELGTAPDPGNGIGFKTLSNGAAVNIRTSDKIKKTDRYSVTVITDDEKGKAAKTAFEEINKNNIENKLVYNAAGKIGDGVKFTLDKFAEGMYYIRVSITDIYGNTVSEYYKFRNVTEDERLLYITEVMTGDLAKVADGIKNIFEEKEILSKGGLSDPDVTLDEEFCKYFIMVRDMLYSKEEAEKISDISVIEKLVNGTILAKALMNNSLKKEIFEKNRGLFAELDDGMIVFEKFMPVFTGLKENVKDSESLKKVLKWSGLLSLIKSATNETAASVIKKNSDTFGINLDYASKKNVSVERACAYIDKEDVVKYYAPNAFDNAFKAAVDKAYGDSSYSPSNVSRPTGSASKPVPGINNGSTKPSNPVVKPNDNNTENDRFNDLSGFEWAKDAINSLAEKNIINGNENNDFLPGDFITRAEFIKMLVMATGIEVKEDVKMYFMDVVSDDWFYPYIAIGYSNALCSGTDEYHFNPRGNLTRQDMAVIINNCKTFNFKSINEEYVPFSDDNTVSDYATAAVENMRRYGIINGFDDNSFKPLANTRRAEAAKIIYSLIESKK